MSTNIYTPVSFRVLSTKRAYYTCKICIKNNARLPRIIYKQAQYFILDTRLLCFALKQLHFVTFVGFCVRPRSGPGHRHTHQLPQLRHPTIYAFYSAVSVGWSPPDPHPQTQCYKNCKLMHTFYGT